MLPCKIRLSAFDIQSQAYFSKVESFNIKFINQSLQTEDIKGNIKLINLAKPYPASHRLSQDR